MTYIGAENKALRKLRLWRDNNTLKVKLNKIKEMIIDCDTIYDIQKKLDVSNDEWNEMLKFNFFEDNVNEAKQIVLEKIQNQLILEITGYYKDDYTIKDGEIISIARRYHRPNQNLIVFYFTNILKMSETETEQSIFKNMPEAKLFELAEKYLKL